MDMTAVSGVITALRGATDITKAMLGMRDNTLIDTKVIELNQAIIGAQQCSLEAQATQAALVEENSSLKKEVARLLAWDEDAKNYDLREIRSGVLTRAYRAKDGDDTPPHHLCVSCFDGRRKSMLQETYLAVGACKILICNTCSTVTYTKGIAQQEHAALLQALTGKRC